MRTHRLGSQGPELSVVGYGAWEAGGTAWGPNESDDAVIGAMRAASTPASPGSTPRRCTATGSRSPWSGARSRSPRRGDRRVEGRPVARGLGVPARADRRCLRRHPVSARTRRIDLYQLHWPDDGVPVEESWGAMAALQAAGKVRWIGVSNFGRELIERCEAVRHVDSLQPEFSMLRRDQADLIAWCGEHGTGVVSYGPLAFGLLTGAITAATTFPEGDWRGRGRRARRSRRGRSVRSRRPPEGARSRGAATPDRRRGRRDAPPARAGVERAPARGDERDRRKQERRPRARERGGRSRARGRRPSRRSMRSSTRPISVPADDGRVRGAQAERSTWRILRTIPSRSFSVTWGSSSSNASR